MFNQLSLNDLSARAYDAFLNPKHFSKYESNHEALLLFDELIKRTPTG